MAAHDPLAESGGAGTARLTAFAARTVKATAVGLALVLVLAHQSRVYVEEGSRGHPLWEALDAVGASVLSTELSLWAPVAGGSPATMSELKQWAGRIAPPGIGETMLYSVVEEGYRAVYFEGADRRGGTWAASARQFAGAADVELSLRRYLYGPLPELRSEVRALRGALERAAGRPLPGAAVKVRIEARPAGEGDPAETASRIIAGAGGSLRFVQIDAERVVARGYTPRLSAWVDDPRTGRYNLEVTVEPRGRASWIVVGWPQL